MIKIFMHDKDMPKGCFGCVCHDDEDTGCCNVTGVYGISPEHSHCPLRSLEAHDAEVRKVAVEEFYHKIYDLFPNDKAYTTISHFTLNMIAKELIENGQRKD